LKPTGERRQEAGSIRRRDPSGRRRDDVVGIGLAAGFGEGATIGGLIIWPGALPDGLQLGEAVRPQGYDLTAFFLGYLFFFLEAPAVRRARIKYYFRRDSV
jgi:hypothetical protein